MVRYDSLWFGAVRYSSVRVASQFGVVPVVCRLSSGGAGRDKGLSESVLDRLLLNDERIETMARDAVSVVSLPDPVGETIEMNTMPIEKTSVP